MIRTFDIQAPALEATDNIVLIEGIRVDVGNPTRPGEEEDHYHIRIAYKPTPGSLERLEAESIQEFIEDAYEGRPVSGEELAALLLSDIRQAQKGLDYASVLATIEGDTQGLKLQVSAAYEAPKVAELKPFTPINNSANHQQW